MYFFDGNIFVSIISDYKTRIIILGNTQIVRNTLFRVLDIDKLLDEKKNEEFSTKKIKILQPARATIYV